jgi:CRP-like cAMP-binding protein
MKWSNHLFAGLPMNVWHSWEGLVELIHLEAGQVLFEIGDKTEHVYFPFTSIISLTHILEGGESIEVAMVGSEGVVGVSVFMASRTTAHRAEVLRAGYAYRLNAEMAKRAFDSSREVMEIMLRFSHAMVSQMSQVAACNRHHTLEEQLSRWLLLYLDRTNDLQVHCTQEQISNTLGVRRERVAKVAKLLQQEGVMHYSRGIIDVDNREQLFHRSCECYGIIKAQYKQVLPIAVRV